MKIRILIAVLFFLFGVGLGAGLFYFKSDVISRTPLLSPVINNPPTKFSLENAPEESIRGTIATFSGKVSFQSRTATIPADLMPGQIVQQGEELSTGKDGSVSLNFPDYALINLKPESDLSIIQTLPVNFVFRLASGSADLNNLGKAPVSVRTMDLLSTLSTGSASFNLDLKTHIITLVFGTSAATAAYNDINFVSHVLNFSSGDRFTFNNDTRLGYLR